MFLGSHLYVSNMTAWWWLNVTAIPMLVIVPMLTAFGLFILVSIIEFIVSNKHLSESGHVTKAQIVSKYERGSLTYYKRDAGKSHFIICEFMIKNIKTKKYMLCQSKFMVDVAIYNGYEAGEFVNVVYLPMKYDKYHNLEILNQNIINTKTIIKRVSLALLIILIAPLIIGIFARSWAMFVTLIMIGIVYYMITFFLFLWCCPNKTCFKNKSFKQRIARRIDLKRFESEIKHELSGMDSISTKLLPSNDSLSSKYRSICSSINERV
eukprot:1165205_1